MQRIAARTGVRKSKTIRRAIYVYLQVNRHKQEVRVTLRQGRGREAGFAPRPLSDRKA